MDDRKQNDMELSKVIKMAIDGKAVLFVGSGFSLGGKTKTGESLVVGKELSHKICSHFGVEMTDNLSIAADRCLNSGEEKVKLGSFIAFLKKNRSLAKLTSDLTPKNHQIRDFM